ncbi:type II toxin-antitoxin system RelE/ParE family toxin [Sandarakinorhabdus sp.]|jgi:mRNA interferase RelE/StbE|uniref:type II toxin-antitoxin system RelE family toxin n=1 Tax=Sandarakinorhabdus sp. TaxID=1916663 RepID=UPI0028B0548D|nr:type II toxin-antitoxin system RelE/ParE family toxin [Sandarakinorhabdus sp.]
MAKPIEFSREALKALSRMDRATARRIIAKIDQLATAPEELANNIKQLAGGEGLMRLRVGDWRVVYRDGQVLAIIRIASRGSVYE